MRLKNNPKAKDIVNNHHLVILDPENYKGKWHSAFNNDNPIYLEIGCGKGQFLSALAKRNPDINYIGIEQYESVLYLALEKADEIQAENLLFICVHAEYLSDFFAENEVDGIYLNFSDPWPKKRHAKRRLTSDRFLPIYNKLLIPGGLIEQKTDNRDLFEYSLESIGESSQFELLASTFDLYTNPEMFSGNISTEYEDKFASQGNPIHKLIARNLKH